MKRKRIVIKLGGQSGGATEAPGGEAKYTPAVVASEERRRVGRPLMIIGIVLVVLIAGALGGAYFWWRSYQSSPAYTLAVLAYAAQKNDIATVDSIFDTDKISDDLAEQIRRQQTSSLPGMINSALPQQFQAEMPAITPEIRQRAHDELVKELQRLTAPAAGKPFVLLAIGIKYFADIRQPNDKAAEVLASVGDEHIRLTMQADPVAHWRIIAVEDDKMVSRIVAKLAPYMKTIPKPSTSKSPLKGSPKSLPEEARKELEKLLGQPSSPSPSP